VHVFEFQTDYPSTYGKGNIFTLSFDHDQSAGIQLRRDVQTTLEEKVSGLLGLYLFSLMT
jgi:hypothetical protein